MPAMAPNSLHRNKASGTKDRQQTLCAIPAQAPNPVMRFQIVKEPVGQGSGPPRHALSCKRTMEFLCEAKMAPERPTSLSRCRGANHIISKLSVAIYRSRREAVVEGWWWIALYVPANLYVIPAKAGIQGARAR